MAHKNCQLTTCNAIILRRIRPSFLRKFRWFNVAHLKFFFLTNDFHPVDFDEGIRHWFVAIRVFFEFSRNFRLKMRQMTTFNLLNARWQYVIASDEPELEFSGSSRAEPSRAGHFNFRAETELNRKFFNSFFPQVFIIRSPVSWF